jgi:hypothetical protein
VSRRRTSPLKPQLNQIRTWTQQGRTDAWMAHKLETSSDVVAEFRAEYGIARGGAGPAAVLEPITPELVAEQALEGFEPSAGLDDEVPAPRRRTRRRAASEEPAAEEAAPPTAAAPTPAPRRRRRATEPAADTASSEAAVAPVVQPAVESAAEDSGERPSRRRSRRRRGAGDEADVVVVAPTPVAPAPPPAPAVAARGVPATLRRTIEIALDSSVLDDPLFREHWLGVAGVVVEVRRDELVLRRAAG